MIWRRPRCDSSNCIEVARVADRVFIHSTLTKGMLVASVGEWDTFLAAAKRGDYDEPTVWQTIAEIQDSVRR